MPRPRRSPFAKAARHTFGIELVVDFDDAVTRQAAAEAARKIVDALRLSYAPTQDPAGVASARLVVAELKRLIRLVD